MTNNEIIKAAEELYGKGHYTYDNVKDSLRKNDNIEIICPEHGSFKKRLSRFLNGSGCPICSGKVRKTTEQFIEDVAKIHGDKYDYSKVSYVNSHTKVCVICPKHGEFYITPTNHLNGVRMSKMFS